LAIPAFIKHFSAMPYSLQFTAA